MLEAKRRTANILSESCVLKVVVSVGALGWRAGAAPPQCALYSRGVPNLEIFHTLSALSIAVKSKSIKCSGFTHDSRNASAARDHYCNLSGWKSHRRWHLQKSIAPIAFLAFFAGRSSGLQPRVYSGY